VIVELLLMNFEEIPESCGAISWLRFDSLLVQSINSRQNFFMTKELCQNDST
jgi:hypothetical protein